MVCGTPEIVHSLLIRSAQIILSSSGLFSVGGGRSFILPIVFLFSPRSLPVASWASGVGFWQSVGARFHILSHRARSVHRLHCPSDGLER